MDDAASCACFMPAGRGVVTTASSGTCKPSAEHLEGEADAPSAPGTSSPDENTVTARRRRRWSRSAGRALPPVQTADDRLAALGLRSLADLLAPSSLVIGDDHLVLDGEYTRVLALPTCRLSSRRLAQRHARRAVASQSEPAPASPRSWSSRQSSEAQELAAGWRPE